MPKAAKVGPSRFDRRQQEILDATTNLINQHGLRDTTLALVGSEIGLNLKSLRYYFERREDLVAACFVRSVDLHRQLVAGAMDAGDPEARVRRFIADYFELRSRVRRKEIAPFVKFGELNALTPPHSTEVMAAYLDLFRAFRALIGDPSREERERLNSRTHYFVSQILWSQLWLAGYLPEDFERVGTRFADILINGIAAGPVDLEHDILPPPAPIEGSERLNQESFLLAATELINQIGYRGASPDRISALLNRTKGAFYHHNDNREELVVACFERTFEILHEAQNAALACKLNGLATIGAATNALVTRQMTREGILLRTSALMAVSQLTRGAMALRLEVYTGRFASILNDGLIDGSVRPCDLHIAAEVVTGMVNSAQELQWWVKSANSENATNLYVRPLMHGIFDRA
ncbi:MAG: TetR/AcrR family transcriptional regulator [Novosphingobium sp.]|nr:TetR/AcrR family transcriptional regulator [Novosphingobium sp.]